MCSVHGLMCTGSCACLFNILANTAQAGSKVKEIDLTNTEKIKCCDSKIVVWLCKRKYFFNLKASSHVYVAIGMS